MRSSFTYAIVIATLLCGMSSAYAGPCTAQIARLEQQIRQSAAKPLAGPSAPQSLAAQLHRQPTPTTFRNAERKADTLADAALARARTANAEGNDAACSRAVHEAEDLYGIS
jgi:hypothetical protein